MQHQTIFHNCVKAHSSRTFPMIQLHSVLPHCVKSYKQPPFIVPAKENPVTLTQNRFFLHHTELLLKTIKWIGSYGWNEIFSYSEHLHVHCNWMCQWFHEWSNGPSQWILGRHFLLPFHKRWFSVSYANGSNKGSVEVLPFCPKYLENWTTLTTMQIQSGHISQSGIFRSKMNFWNAPNGSNLCVIFTVILQKI